MKAAGVWLLLGCLAVVAAHRHLAHERELIANGQGWRVDNCYDCAEHMSDGVVFCNHNNERGYCCTRGSTNYLCLESYPGWTCSSNGDSPFMIYA